MGLSGCGSPRRGSGISTVTAPPEDTGEAAAALAVATGVLPITCVAREQTHKQHDCLFETAFCALS